MLSGKTAIKSQKEKPACLLNEMCLIKSVATSYPPKATITVRVTEKKQPRKRKKHDFCFLVSTDFSRNSKNSETEERSLVGPLEKNSFKRIFQVPTCKRGINVDVFED